LLFCYDYFDDVDFFWELICEGFVEGVNNIWVVMIIVLMFFDLFDNVIVFEFFECGLFVIVGLCIVLFCVCVLRCLFVDFLCLCEIVVVTCVVGVIDDGVWFDEVELKELFCEVGVVVFLGGIVDSVDECFEVVCCIGWLVVLKLFLFEICYKIEVGGFVL